MIAKDKNNRIIREADWISYNNRVYQVDGILANGVIECWWKYIKSTNKVNPLINIKILKSNTCIKIDPPTAYNITDNE